ncbi:MAG: CDP-alcohol phosphatidyltransferase family protein [Candidatus Scalindua sp.]|jgi:hypothetical protein|nr:CDP-alcohol phosphatidyltransferase family protein [Candidatus Scalindua sp.]MBT5305060.1 CDP-alcohol phosphatidyltransferase family protein [Candidatus Scalindua sp.]MBT6048061.1 CDP-alcohol phosphatidyltransferase family protein [Candidatus Scalindua sp.]MBT6228724.1 CDP-alcohol phosphatidyltransferase family protein [Candidatus Scalindua sp.]MBT6563251.1 CDP-alcohol phosphatidyltransferase family protein [Candidatus Scalindua sp.]
MATNKYPTLREIRDTHAWKREYERYLPLSRFVFRPVGFLLTWLAIRVGLTSEAVSWWSGFVGLIGYGCLMSGREQLLPFGIGALIFFNILDCVDGSISRCMKTQNPYGQFLDSIMAWIDMGFWALIGIMAFRNPEFLFCPNPMGYSPIFWLAVGGLACYFHNLIGLLEGTFEQYIRVGWNGIRTDSNNSSDNMPNKDGKDASCPYKRTLISIIGKINHNLRVRETHYLLLVLAYLSKVIDLLLITYLFYYFIHVILLLVIYCCRGRQLRKFYLQERL